MSIDRIAVYHLTPHEDGSFHDIDGLVFDMEAYSRMKYGDAATGWQYGQKLADAIIETAPDKARSPNVLVSVPACVYSPKPAFSIARSMLTALNRYRSEEGIDSARIMRMYSDEMGDPRYATFSEEERARDRNSTRQGHLVPSLVKAATIFAVDDCVITGNTEILQRSILEPFEPEEIITTPVIEIDPVLAAEFPGIENEMNLAAAVDIDDIIDMIRRGTFALNSRVLKLVLTDSDEATFTSFLRECPLVLRQEMYESITNATLDFLQTHSSRAAILGESLKEF